MTDSAPVRGMKRIGSSGNFMRVVPANEHLLKDTRMVEISLVMKDGKLVEDGAPNRDFLASKDLNRIVAEIITLDSKRSTLVAHAAGLIGGREVLESQGIEVPEQTIHDTPAGRSKANNAKQNAKAKGQAARKRAARTKQREEAKAIDAAKKAGPTDEPVEGIVRLPPTPKPEQSITQPAPAPESDEDI